MGRKALYAQRFSAHQHRCYGVPPVNLTNSVQDFFGTKPFLNRPEPLQKLQVSAASSTENQ